MHSHASVDVYQMRTNYVEWRAMLLELLSTEKHEMVFRWEFHNCRLFPKKIQTLTRNETFEDQFKNEQC